LCFQVKADRYWSETADESVTYGPITVTLKSSETNDTVIIRKFQIQKQDIADVKEVVHLQYTGWPDMEVPKEMDNYSFFFGIYRETREFIEDSRPIIVHCSAGVGRSGTFIALDMMLDHIRYQLFNEGNHIFMLNIPKMVSTLRSERPGMIQSKVTLFGTELRDLLNHT
jgi:protein tyrosine phosphatase